MPKINPKATSAIASASLADNGAMHTVGAHSPTEQAALQTGDIARLGGGELHQETAGRDEASTRSAQECEATIQSAHRVRSEGRGRSDYEMKQESVKPIRDCGVDSHASRFASKR